MHKKSQAAFEYMVLVAGVLLIVVIATVAFRIVFQSPVESVQASNCWLKLAKDSNCYVGSQWNACGQVDRARYEVAANVFCAPMERPGGCTGDLPSDKLWCGQEGGGINFPSGSPTPSASPKRSFTPLGMFFPRAAPGVPV